MCGGGAPRGTIQQPNYGAYSMLASQQLQAMQMAQSGDVLAAQRQIQSETMRQQQVMADLAAAKTAAANDTTAAAARLAALVGTPPPDKTAKAPVIGADRQGMTRAQGRKAVRIDLQPPTTTINLGG